MDLGGAGEPLHIPRCLIGVKGKDDVRLKKAVCMLTWIINQLMENQTPSVHSSFTYWAGLIDI